MGVTVRWLQETTARPRVHRTLLTFGKAGASALIGLFAFGVVMLATLLAWLYVAIGVVLLAAIPVLVSRVAGGARGVLVPVLALLATIVPVVGLLAFDVLWASAGIARPGPDIGLVIAGVVIAGTAYVYLRWLGETPRCRRAPPEERRRAGARSTACGARHSALRRSTARGPRRRGRPAGKAATNGRGASATRPMRSRRG